MTGMTGNLVYGLLGKTKSANWYKYFADSSEIWSDESKPPDMIWHTEYGAHRVKEITELKATSQQCLCAHDDFVFNKPLFVL